MARVSSTVRRVKRRWLSSPGTSGRVGWAPGGQEEFVILLGGDRPGLQVLYRDGLGRRVDGGGLVAHPGIDAEPLPEPLGGLEGERLLILDHPRRCNRAGRSWRRR